MEVISMHQAKSSLSHLVKRAAAGETILIGVHGKAEAKLVSVNDALPHQNRLGLMKGKIKMAEDFDAPLPDDIQDAFEGGR